MCNEQASLGKNRRISPNTSSVGSQAEAEEVPVNPGFHRSHQGSRVIEAVVSSPAFRQQPERGTGTQGFSAGSLSRNREASYLPDIAS